MPPEAASERLSALEDQVRAGAGFYTQGTALDTIRTQRLHPGEFEDYCPMTFSMNRKHAAELIVAARAAAPVMAYVGGRPGMPRLDLPLALALAGLDDDQTVRVYETARDGSKLTVRALRAARKQLNLPEPPNAQLHLATQKLLRTSSATDAAPGEPMAATILAPPPSVNAHDSEPVADDGESVAEIPRPLETAEATTVELAIPATLDSSVIVLNPAIEPGPQAEAARRPHPGQPGRTQDQEAHGPGERRDHRHPGDPPARPNAGRHRSPGRFAAGLHYVGGGVRSVDQLADPDAHPAIGSRLTPTASPSSAASSSMRPPNIFEIYLYINSRK